MRNFENELSEFNKKYGTEEQCREYLFRLRWSDGIFRCPECRHDQKWDLSEIEFKCTSPSCRAKTSLTSGTILHGVHKSLCCWFRAIWYVTSGGTNISQLQRLSELGSYHTARNWYYDIRKMMRDSGHYKLYARTTFEHFMQDTIKPPESDEDYLDENDFFDDDW